MEERKPAIHDFLTVDEQKLMIDLIPDMLMLVTPSDGRVVYSNRPPPGMTLQDLIGSRYEDLGCEESRADMLKALNDTISVADVVEREVQVRGVDGYQWTLIRLIPVIREGRPFYILITHTDITPLKNVIAELEVSRKRLSDHLEQTPLAAMMWDQNQITVEWNPAAEKIFGYTREEAIGRPFTELIAPESEWQTRQEQFAYALERGEIKKYPPYANCTKDGRTIVCEWFSTAIRNSDGEIVGIASLAQDVTAKLQAEKELQAAKLQAEASARAKTNFLANMSHEIRTPMNGILGMIELLAQDGLNETQQDKLDIIHQSTRTLLAILNDILDFSKIESSAMVIESIPLDLNDLLRQVVELMRPAIEKKGLAFHWQPLPEQYSHILGDPNRLTQILSNLISNAIKFTEQGSIAVETSASRLAGDEIQLGIEVIDTGIGIQSDDLKHIFDDFSQADASITRRYGGTGLGLTICQRLAGLMNGRIKAQSEYRKGSRFLFQWQTRLTELEKQTPEKAQDLPLQQFQQAVLLVDDNEINLQVGAKMLERLGLEVFCARNGHEALQCLQDLPQIKLVLMDVHMPEMNGIEATREIRKLGGCVAQLPVIAVTANVLDEEKSHCLKAGMDGFLGKPFTLAGLNKTLARWLND